AACAFGCGTAPRAHEQPVAITSAALGSGSTWKLAGDGTLSPRGYHAIAYDSTRNKLVLFGGHGGLGDTLECDGERWNQTASTGPSPRQGHAMAYDSARGKVVLFGGTSPQGGVLTPLNDTWEWDGTSWTQVASSGPSPRQFHAMAYDSTRRRIVLFGGTN